MGALLGAPDGGAAGAAGRGGPLAAFLDLFDHIQAHVGDGKYREMKRTYSAATVADAARGPAEPGGGPEASLARLRDRGGPVPTGSAHGEPTFPISSTCWSPAVAGTLVAAGPAIRRARGPV